MLYEAVYYDGDAFDAGYILIEGVEGDTPEQALAENLEHLTTRVIEMYELDNDASTRRKVQETVYVLRADALVSARNVVGAGS